MALGLQNYCTLIHAKNLEWIILCVKFVWSLNYGAYQENEKKQRAMLHTPNKKNTKGTTQKQLSTNNYNLSLSFF